METFWTVKAVVTLLLMIAVIVLLLSYKQIKGKGLLLYFAFLSAVTMLGFLVLPIMYRYWGYFDRATMLIVNVVMSLGNLAAAVCMLCYVISIKGGNAVPVQASAGFSPEQVASVNRSNPYYGVKGWLKFVVICLLFISPALFIVTTIASFAGSVYIANRYPGIIIVALLEMSARGFLVYKGIMAGRALRDIQPMAVQKVRLLLKLALGWTMLSFPISFLAGLPPERILPRAIMNLIAGIVGFSIWYSYFNTSRRVEATYPDWKA